MKTLKEAKSREYLRIRHRTSEVYRVVRVIERITKRGRNGFTIIRIQFDNGKVYSVEGADLYSFLTWDANAYEIFKFLRTLEGFVTLKPVKPPEPSRNEFFMKWAGMIPSTPEEYKTAKKRMALALHPDRSGFDSNELFIKAMELCE